jgi:hypothetical protein
MKIYNEDGRLLIPLTERKQFSRKEENKVRYIIGHAYCPNGHSIIDSKNKINGFPGLRLKFKRAEAEGEFVISAIEGDFNKILLSGVLQEGVKDDLYCPHCGIMFEKLVNCNCKPGAEMVVIGLTPELDFNEAITFCNVTGCHNGTFIKSGDVIRHIRLTGSY